MSFQRFFGFVVLVWVGTLWAAEGLNFGLLLRWEEGAVAVDLGLLTEHCYNNNIWRYGVITFGLVIR